LCCSVLQCAAVCCVCCSVLPCVAVCCSVYLCVAVCAARSVSQCVAVCCSVLQCICVLQCVRSPEHRCSSFVWETYVIHMWDLTRCRARRSVSIFYGNFPNPSKTGSLRYFLPPARSSSLTYTHSLSICESRLTSDVSQLSSDVWWLIAEVCQIQRQLWDITRLHMPHDSLLTYTRSRTREKWLRYCDIRLTSDVFQIPGLMRDMCLKWFV